MVDERQGAELGQLAERIAAGDAGAEAALVAHVTPRVQAMMRARTRDPDLARDLTQETLIAVLVAARGGRIRDRDRVMAFVHGVARNIANNQARSHRQRAEEPLDDHDPVLRTVDPGPERERQAVITRGLDELSAADREILCLTLIEGLKPGEIAVRLGLTAEIVRARKSRAQRRMAEAVAALSRTAPTQPR